MAMAYFTTSQGWIAYRTLGSGPPVLLLHGALGTARAHFGRLAGRLAEQYRLILPDLPGHGASAPRQVFSRDYYKEDALTFGCLADALGITSIHVLGFSDGAMMALSLAADRPDLVRSVVAIGGQAYIDEPTVAGLRSWAEVESLPEAWRQSFARLHGEPYWRELTWAYVAGQERILAAGGEVVRDRLSQITCPALIMHGRDDTVIDVAHADVVAAGIAAAFLVIYNGCGHNVLRDREPEAIDLIASFLARSSVEAA
jgi:valacyclovir hydrolase